jgi:hypothetical protein
VQALASSKPQNNTRTRKLVNRLNITRISVMA